MGFLTPPSSPPPPSLRGRRESDRKVISFCPRNKKPLKVAILNVCHVEQAASRDHEAWWWWGGSGGVGGVRGVGHAVDPSGRVKHPGCGA